LIQGGPLFRSLITNAWSSARKIIFGDYEDKEESADMDNVIRAIEKERMRTDLPEIKVGDTVKVHVKVVEGTKERLQTFEGYVIAKKNGKPKPKYGQWAPFMDSHLFESLLQQARIRGLLNET
jgi:hypothetical protein